MCYKQFRVVKILVDRSPTSHLRRYNNTRKQQKIFQLPIELKVSKSPKTSFFFFFWTMKTFLKWLLTVPLTIIKLSLAKWFIHDPNLSLCNHRLTSFITYKQDKRELGQINEWMFNVRKLQRKLTKWKPCWLLRYALDCKWSYYCPHTVFNINLNIAWEKNNW